MKSGFKIGAQCAIAVPPFLAAALPALQPAHAAAHDSLDPTVPAPQAEPGSVARAGSPRYGIVANPAEPRQLEAIRKAGAKITPVDVRWRDVEPSPTAPANFNWSKYDPLFANLRRGGITPFVIIQGAPAWARAPGSSGIIRSDQFDEFAQFVEALVTRYRGQTTYWSFYNEPDCNGDVPADAPSACWGNAGAAYARMLQAVYPAVKRADPKALVIFGGIAFDNFQPSNGFARNFVDDALAAGASRPARSSAVTGRKGSFCGWALVLPLCPPPDARLLGGHQQVEDDLLVGADGIAFDRGSTLYVAVFAQDSIVAVSPNGELTTLAQGYPLQNPASLAVAGSNLYITNFAFLKPPGTQEPSLLRLALPLGR